ncbi:MAG TPA: ferritin-like domain-containing protein [Bacteroidales bacterium]|nr:ferritin-like domain-containing protein [Bacteroidales bacterium]
MKTSTQEIKDKFMHDKTESETIHRLFEDQLKDIYWAEQELTRFMPKVVENIESSDLVKTLLDHMRVTEKQVTRLEKIFDIIGTEAQGEKCDGMEGLVIEARKIFDETGKGIIRDAFLIGAVQKMEHYEMASYGTLKSMATILGEYEVATLLGETLKEEKDADMKLTEVAENVINIDASRQAGELEEEEEEEEFEEDEEEDVEMDDEQFEDTGSKGKITSKSKSKSSR